MKRPVVYTLRPPGSAGARPFFFLVAFALIEMHSGLYARGFAEDLAQPFDSRQRERPNVVFIVADTLRADAATAKINGTWLMPNLRKLADESIEFTNTTSQESFTLPSMVSLFTSLHPEVHQIASRVRKVEGKFVNPAAQARIDHLRRMVSYFKEAGYATIGVQTNPHLRPGSGFDTDFDQYHYDFGAPAERVVTLAGSTFAHAEPPYFLYVHFFDPHNPYFPHPEHHRRVGGMPNVSEEERRLLHQAYMDYYDDVVRRNFGEDTRHDFPSLSMDGRSYLRKLYDGEAAYLDHHLGRLLGVLEVMRLLNDNDVVVFVGDHGEEFWEHGSLGHANTAYHEVIRVPFIARFPGRAPARVEAPVELIDVLPTLAGAVGIPADPHWQGRNLLTSKLDPDHPRISRARGVSPRLNIRWDAVQLGRWKYLIHTARNVEELYDVEFDPLESNNLISDHAKTADNLRAILRRFKADSSSHPLANIKHVYSDIDAETLEELRAVGYVN